MKQFSKIQLFSSSKGITLVEVLVVVFLVTLFSGVLIANFPKIKLQFALSGVVHKFAQDLKNTQELGGAGSQIKENNVIVAVKGHGIHINFFTLGNKKYITYADKNGDQQYNFEDDGYPIKQIDLSHEYPGIIIHEIVNANSQNLSINFRPPNFSTAISSLVEGQNSVEIIFATESDLENTKTVSINSLGLIEIK
jgi:Tfp pilus assembly protein FimT